MTFSHYFLWLYLLHIPYPLAVCAVDHRQHMSLLSVRCLPNMALSVEPVQHINCLQCIHAKLTLTAPQPIQHLTSAIHTYQPSNCWYIVSCLCTWEVLLHPLCWHNSWEFSSAGQSKKINAKIEGWTNTDKARKWPCSKSLTKQRWPMSATGGYAASHSSEVLSRPSDPGRIFSISRPKCPFLFLGPADSSVLPHPLPDV